MGMRGFLLALFACIVALARGQDLVVNADVGFAGYHRAGKWTPGSTRPIA